MPQRNSLTPGDTGWGPPLSEMPGDEPPPNANAFYRSLVVARTTHAPDNEYSLLLSVLTVHF